jgi:hypothetical protein
MTTNSFKATVDLEVTDDGLIVSASGKLAKIDHQYHDEAGEDFAKRLVSAVNEVL